MRTALFEPEKLAAKFFEQGFVVLRQAISPAQISAWRKEFDQVFADKQHKDLGRCPFISEIGGNHDRNRWNMHIPSTSTMFAEAFFAQDQVLELLDHIFQGKYSPVFIASDIALPGSSNQTIHQDGGDFAVAVNIPLIDVTRQNGPTAAWPGTHRYMGRQPFSYEPMDYSAAEMGQIVARFPMQFLEMAQGDILIRDLRMVHRGTFNGSTADRPYLSTIFFPVKMGVPKRKDLNAASARFRAMRQHACLHRNHAAYDAANEHSRLPDMAGLTDRNQFRPIPAHVFEGFSPKVQEVLNFAEVEGRPEIKENFDESAGLEFLDYWKMAEASFKTLCDEAGIPNMD